MKLRQGLRLYEAVWTTLKPLKTISDTFHHFLMQEAHMDEPRRQKIEDLFQQRLRILATSDPEHPTARGGVAIALNKEIVEAQQE